MTILLHVFSAIALIVTIAVLISVKKASEALAERVVVLEKKTASIVAE